MNKLLWTLQALVALAFAASGGMKVANPDALRANPQMAWTQDFSNGDIRAIGSAELLGAAGLILPAATGIVPVLTPVAGTGLALLMGGATATHLRRGEPPVAPAVLGVLALSVGLLRGRRQRQQRLVAAAA
ncbi:MAG: DoxX family protein [Gemmatimonadaceae bacterium]|nr:DoxX family protein [Gemmatimonadaceae bacterium]